MSNAPLSSTMVTIGKVRMKVPILGDQATTERIARQVSEYLERMEEESDRIDTQAFAYQAAFHFAAALHEEQAERGSDERELAMALDRIVSSMADVSAILARSEG